MKHVIANQLRRTADVSSSYSLTLAASLEVAIFLFPQIARRKYWKTIMVRMISFEIIVK
ncbi:hypothetical protein [Pseudomonas sp. BN411]|uniref:hypothetical protein n=1 Tax=Pseudomonas sp. BN411 TaxID=2567887 RepID=UPI0024546D76|nr:hypothetical protein [Pseudomonas sp. BN411]